MSSALVSKGSESNPTPPRVASSIPYPSTPDATDSPSHDKLQRADTPQSRTAPEVVIQDSSREARGQKPDAFESGSAEEDRELEIPRASIDIGIIPIELVSMTDK